MARKITSLKARKIFKTRLLLGLVLKPLRLFCEHCDKYVPSDMEWVCGHCNEHNHFTKYYSFLNKCRRCKRPPKSYICPHCGAVNYLDKDEESLHPARQIDNTVPAPPLDHRVEKRQAHEERKEDLANEIEIARLNAALARLKESAEFGFETEAMRKLEKSFSEHDAHVMGVHKIEAREEKLIPEKYKDDPVRQDQARDSLKKWVSDNID